MLFKRNNRSFKFYLLNLDYLEYKEISRLITENGGEVCDNRDPPVITFSSCEASFGEQPVFHVNYIRECVRHGKLLDLVQFKFGCRAFAGCLMSIFIRGNNLCPSINDVGSCCSPKVTEQREQAPPSINEEHNYAQGDCAMEQTVEISSEIPQPTLSPSLQAPEFSPHQSPRDSEFLPDTSPLDSVALPADLPGDSEFLPDTSPQNLVEFPAAVPQDSEFLPEESPLVARFSPDDTEFMPDESPPNPQLPPDDSPLVLHSSLNGSPPDSEFLPDESPPGLDLEQNRSQEYSEFVIDEPPLGRDSEFLPEDSASSIGTIVPESPERDASRTERDSESEIPEPARFEELSFCRGVYSPLKYPGNGCEKLCKTSPTASIDTVIIAGRSKGSYSPIRIRSDDERLFKKMTRTCSQDTLIIGDRNMGPAAAPGLNVARLYPLSDEGGDTERSDDQQGFSVERENKMLLEARLRRLQTSKPITPERGSSPVFRLKKIAKKTAAREVEAASGTSRRSISPTILRDESNRVKILGKPTIESLRDLETFRISSSDSDATDYAPSPVMNTRDSKRLEDRSLSLRIKELNRSQERFKKGKGQPGPSRESEEAPEDAEETGATNDRKKTGRLNRPKKGSEKDDRRTSTRKNASWVSNEERHTMVSSTKSSEDGSVGNRDSDPLSEDEAAASSSRKTGDNKPLPKKTPTQTQGRNVVLKQKKRLQPLTRNFLPWEQKEMVQYLIDKEFISEAKGNKVWKQMIHDGHLPHRTYQSLNNHFRKSILPHIHRFPMKRDALKKFQRLIQ